MALTSMLCIKYVLNIFILFKMEFNVIQCKKMEKKEEDTLNFQNK